MKNIFKLMLMVTPLLVVTMSCEEEEDEVLTFVDVENDLSFPDAPGFSISFSEIDDAVAIDVVNQGNDNELEVFQGGQPIGTLTLTPGGDLSTGTFNTTLAALGIEEDGDDTELRFYADGPDGRSYRPLTISTFEPLSLDLSTDEIVQSVEDTSALEFEATLTQASIGNITAIASVNGTPFDTVTTTDASGSVFFTGNQFEVGDTVMISVTATNLAGTLSSTETTSFVVGVFEFANESAALDFDTTAVGYDLEGDSLTSTTADADIFRVSAANSIGLGTSDSLSLIPVSMSEYNTGDQVATERLFTSGGTTPVNEVAEVSEGDTFAYRLETSPGTFSYGLIMIGDVDRSSEEDDNTFEITIKN